MKVGVFTVLFSQRPFEEALDYIVSCGIEAVELGTGNYPGNAHCNPDELLESEAARKKLLKAVTSRGLTISALSCHGNPLHPDDTMAKEHHGVHRKTVQLAKELGVGVVVNFSGCPGEGPGSKRPNWVTCPWPPDYTKILKWQWKEKVIPYWTEEARFAKSKGVKIAFEMHPGFVVYNPETLLRLRERVGKNGKVLGANFDPSHLFWQGIDPCAALRVLKDCVFHFHAKDTHIYEWNSKVNGVLDTKPYGDETNRSWIFRTVGYGHSYQVWKDMVSTLKMIGYDGALSIEHEDSLMSVNEGFRKAVAFLKDVIVAEKAGAMWWA
jgi:sugar phosphate isomerase/epimerase